tara:strand:- start:75 stop:491 length:417 start_codon:yes stop_codon:yes gene_type:complete
MVRNSGITLECSSTVAASSAIGAIHQCNIKTSPNSSTTQKEVFVPQTENWVLTDMYVVSTSDYGSSQPMVEFIKNRGISMGTSTSLVALLVTSNTRPRFLPSAIGFEAGSILQMQTINTIAEGGSAATIKFFVAVSIQ